jgi:outer membrane receptor protein involved in Fe transport
LYAGKSVPGALLFDSNIHYGGQLNAAKWTVDLGVDNLFDKKYYTILQVNNLTDSLPRQPQETRKLYLTLRFVVLINVFK